MVFPHRYLSDIIAFRCEVELLKSGAAITSMKAPGHNSGSGSRT